MIGYAEDLVAVAAFGLDGARVADLPRAPLDDDAWHRFLGAIRTQRLSGLLLAAVAVDEFPVTAEQADGLHDVHAAAMSHVLHLERRLLEVVDRFERVGIDHRVLKGPATAHLLYADPALRPFVDVDVLVPSSHFDEAVALLVAAGHRRTRPQLRASFDRRFAKSVTLVADDGLEVDLHRTLAAGRFGLAIDDDFFFAGSSPFPLGGRVLSALGLEERFLNACYHAAAGDARPNLLTLRDVVELMALPLLDVSRVQRLSRAWRGQPVLAEALTMATTLLGVEVPERWASACQHRAAPLERLALQSYRLRRRRFALQSLSALAVIPGARARGAYVLAMLLPERAFLETTTRGGYCSWWRGGARGSPRQL